MLKIILTVLILLGAAIYFLYDAEAKSKIGLGRLVWIVFAAIGMLILFWFRMPMLFRQLDFLP